VSKYNIGTSLVLDGEKEYKQAVTNINQSIAVFAANVGKTTAEMNLNSQSTKSLTDQQKALQEQLTGQKAKVDLLTKALASSAEKNGENDSKTKAWQKSLYDAEKEVAKTEQALKDNSKALDDNAKKAKEAANKTDFFASFIKDLKTKLNDTKTSLKDFNTYLEASGKVIAGITGLAIAAAAAIGTMALKASEAADSIDKNSQKLGLSRQAYQEWDYILKQNGASISNMTASMKTLQVAMSGVTEDGGKANEAFARIGLSLEDLQGKDPEEVFELTVKALQNMPPGAEKTAAALALLGKNAMDLMPLLNSSAGSVDNLKERAHELGLIMGDKAIDAGVGFSNMLTDVKASLGAMANSIGAQFLPAMSKALDAFLGFLNGTEGAEEKLNSAVDLLVKTLSQKLPEFINKGIQIILSILKGIAKALPELVRGVMEIIPLVVATILEMLPQVLEAAIQLVATIAKGIAEAVPTLIPTVIYVLQTLITTILDNLPMFISAALQLVVALAAGIVQAIPQLLTAVPEIIKALITAIINLVPEIAKSGIELVKGLWSGISSAAGWLWQQITSWLNGVVDGIKGFFGIKSPSTIFAGIGQNLALGLGDGFKHEMTAVTKQMNKAIPTEFEVAAQTNITGGQRMAEGIVNGLSATNRQGGTVNINLKVDGRTLAEVIYDYLDGVARQRGVAYG